MKLKMQNAEFGMKKMGCDNRIAGGIVALGGTFNAQHSTLNTQSIAPITPYKYLGINGRPALSGFVRPFNFKPQVDDRQHWTQMDADEAEDAQSGTGQRHFARNFEFIRPNPTESECSIFMRAASAYVRLRRDGWAIKLNQIKGSMYLTQQGLRLEICGS